MNMTEPVQATLFANPLLPLGEERSLEPQLDPELQAYLEKTGASVLTDSEKVELLNGSSEKFNHIFYKGDPRLLKLPAVSVVGTRTPTESGIERAEVISKVLVEMGFVVLSGLAKGIDTVAHKTALSAQGKTIAVLGTPIHQVYPTENKALAESIATHGLLMSPALPNETHGKYLFPRRNKLMATLSKATIIIEAGPTSGVVHQAAECLRQKRKLILLDSLTKKPELTWVPDFIRSGAVVAQGKESLREMLRELM